MTSEMQTDGQKYLLILDRDGTLIKDVDYLKDPAEVEFEDRAIEGLRYLVAQGAVPVIITNQSGVGRGYFTEESVAAVHLRIDQMLRVENITIARYYFCPHHPDTNCHCRKPHPGLAWRAADDLSLRLDRATVIGDKISDLKLAQAIGARGILVRTGKGRECADEALTLGFEVTDNLADAAALLLKNG